MGALIILHGLFVLHCNAGSKPIDSPPPHVVSLQPQTCEILTEDTSGHSYRVGATTLVELPFSTNLSVTLKSSHKGSPGPSDLDSRMMVLDSSVKVISGDATMRIVVPMPDNIYGANALKVLRGDVLHGTDTTALRSQADVNNRIRLAESIVLSYNSGTAFSLQEVGQDGVGHDVPGAVSELTKDKKNQVLAFFAWPVMPNMPCNPAMNHVPLNPLLLVNGKAPTFQLMGLDAKGWFDDQESSDFKLGEILRPPCVQASMVRAKHRKGRMFTGSQTGCGPEVVIHDDGT
jgi:hypothetical protein